MSTNTITDFLKKYSDSEYKTKKADYVITSSQEEITALEQFKSSLINQKIEESKFMLSLDKDYSFENDFIKIDKIFWIQATETIKKILLQVREKFLRENKINFNIKPGKSWNIILYLDKPGINMIVNFNSQDINASTYSIAYFSHKKIIKHYWDYEFNSLCKDILYYFRDCCRYDW